MARWETPRRGGLWVIYSHVTRNQHLFHFSPNISGKQLRLDATKGSY